MPQNIGVFACFSRFLCDFLGYALSVMLYPLAVTITLVRADAAIMLPNGVSVALIHHIGVINRCVADVGELVVDVKRVIRCQIHIGLACAVSCTLIVGKSRIFMPLRAKVAH